MQAVLTGLTITQQYSTIVLSKLLPVGRPLAYFIHWFLMVYNFCQAIKSYANLYQLLSPLWSKGSFNELNRFYGATGIGNEICILDPWRHKWRHLLYDVTACADVPNCHFWFVDWHPSQPSLIFISFSLNIEMCYCVGSWVAHMCNILSPAGLSFAYLQ